MTNFVAIIVATLIIAGTAAFLLRWELHSDHGFVRLDRWTGSVSVCVPTGSSVLDCKRGPNQAVNPFDQFDKPQR